MSKLSGKTALITGAAKRIGSVIAARLAHEGVNIVVHYRNSRKEAEATHAKIGELGVKSWILSCDLSNPKDCETLIDRAIDSAGKLDILINNASIFTARNFDDFKLGDINGEMDINAWVPLILSRKFAAKANEGQIVNLLDTRIRGYDSNHFPYYLSKRMLETITEFLALELAPRIRVNGVAPGLIMPPEGKGDSYLERLKDGVPLKKRGSPSDVAEAVFFLTMNDFITGQIIYVDGGKHLTQTIEGF